jgi:murein DD-endopeptidase MepM/ murein hydrolase activator NlpD
LPRPTKKSGSLPRIARASTVLGLAVVPLLGTTSGQDMPVWLQAALLRPAHPDPRADDNGHQKANRDEPIGRPALEPVVWQPAAPSPPPVALERLTAPAPNQMPPLAWEDLLLATAPAPEQHPASPEASATRVVVARGDTLLSILSRAGLEQAEAHGAVSSLKAVYDPRHLQPGQEITMELEAGGDSGDVRLAGLSIKVDPTSDLRLARTETGAFEAETIEHELASATQFVGGRIAGSLYNTAVRAGLSPSAFIQLTKLFSWDVDFQRDIHPGDGLEALVEKKIASDGVVVVDSTLLYVGLRLRDRELTAYRFQRNDGSIDYFDAEGRPLRKWLLRTPVDGARQSSSFGPRRHPILGYTRMHKGIDFAAATGTPILAAGDGVVEMAGRNRGYGNYVRIRHNGSYSTAYAHLSRFAKGVTNGQRVSQGQVIGYVGSTGMSTGPHLHYELLHDGKQINPLSVKTVENVTLTGKELARFKQTLEEVAARREIAPEPPRNYAQR